MDSKIICPKCKGCGEIPPPRKRTKMPKSLNPNERFCCMCSSFKIHDDFYRNKKGKVVGYCRKCQGSKPRSPRNKKLRKARIYRYECRCNMCGKLFMGYKKDQFSCSTRCHMVRLNGSILDKLPNELAAQLRDEGY